MNVPLLNLSVLYHRHQKELDDAIARVLSTHQFILGPEVACFEAEMAQYLGADALTVATSNGTDALLLALRALEIGAGDEVITPAYSFVASASVIVLVGAKPVFVDVERDSLTVDPADLAEKLSSRTKAVIAVHLFGRSADNEAITDVLTAAGMPDCPIIEDTAQALGASYNGRLAGTFGTFGSLSFFPSKNLGAFGDGGMVVARDSRLAARIRLLRAQGATRRYYHEEIGYNARLDALQAAILRARLPHLDEWIAERRSNAKRYRHLFEQAELAELITLPVGDGDGRYFHTYNQFNIRVKRDYRDGLRAHLDEHQVGTGLYYPLALPYQPCFSQLGHGLGEFPEAERACSESLALPVYPGLEPKAQDYVVDAIAQFFQTRA